MADARRVRIWKGPNASRGYEVTGPAGLLGLVARSLQVAGPRASMCGLPWGAQPQPGYLPYWPAALPFAQLPRALGFLLGLQGRGVTASRPGVSIPGWEKHRSPESWFPGMAVRSQEKAFGDSSKRKVC